MTAKPAQKAPARVFRRTTPGTSARYFSPSAAIRTFLRHGGGIWLGNQAGLLTAG